MQHNVKVCIDHATIYCKDKRVLNELFSSLGFFSKNDVHYMLPNSYFELYQPRSAEETYAFFGSDAGLHSFIFWNDDIDACYKRVTGAGYVPAMPVSEFSRPADHGEPRGTAVFRGFYMASELLPIGETAVVQQMTPQFIYPAKPYAHPNGVLAMDRMLLCIEGEAEQQYTAKALADFCAVVSKDRPARNCITELEIGSNAELLAKYGVSVDPTRSCCTGIRYRVQDLAKLREIVKVSNRVYSERNGEICVDASREANLILIFAQA